MLIGTRAARSTTARSIAAQAGPEADGSAACRRSARRILASTDGSQNSDGVLVLGRRVGLEALARDLRREVPRPSREVREPARKADLRPRAGVIGLREVVREPLDDAERRPVAHLPQGRHHGRRRSRARQGRGGRIPERDARAAGARGAHQRPSLRQIRSAPRAETRVQRVRAVRLVAREVRRKNLTCRSGSRESAGGEGGTAVERVVERLSGSNVVERRYPHVHEQLVRRAAREDMQLRREPCRELRERLRRRRGSRSLWPRSTRASR